MYSPLFRNAQEDPECSAPPGFSGAVRLSTQDYIHQSGRFMVLNEVCLTTKYYNRILSTDHPLKDDYYYTNMARKDPQYAEDHPFPLPRCIYEYRRAQADDADESSDDEHSDRETGRDGQKLKGLGAASHSNPNKPRRVLETAPQPVGAVLDLEAMPVSKRGAAAEKELAIRPSILAEELYRELYHIEDLILQRRHPQPDKPKGFVFHVPTNERVNETSVPEALLNDIKARVHHVFELLDVGGGPDRLIDLCSTKKGSVALGRIVYSIHDPDIRKAMPPKLSAVTVLRHITAHMAALIPPNVPDSFPQQHISMIGDVFQAAASDITMDSLVGIMRGLLKLRSDLFTEVISSSLGGALLERMLTHGCDLVCEEADDADWTEIFTAVLHRALVCSLSVLSQLNVGGMPLRSAGSSTDALWQLMSTLAFLAPDEEFDMMFSKLEVAIGASPGAIGSQPVLFEFVKYLLTQKTLRDGDVETE